MSIKVLKVTYDSEGEIISKELTEYPNKSLKNAVLGLSNLIKYFYIEEENEPEYNSNQSYLSSSYELTDVFHDTYTHLLIATKTYTVSDYDSDIIIEKLNTSVGDHIESALPLWKQNKYLSRYIYLKELLDSGEITDDQISEMQYLGDLDTWANECRAERDNREEEYLNNGTFPSFEWDEMPTRQEE